MNTPGSLFISYAHEDETWVDRLRAHLATLRQNGLVKDWHDRRIAPGDSWQTAISQELDNATLILAVVSPSFLDSDYIRGVEMARALERHARGDARVVPVILRAVDWEETPLGEISSEVVDERERRRTLLGIVSSQPPRPRCHPGERYATYAEAYHRDDGRNG